MIKDVSKQYAAMFAEAAEEEKKYSDACEASCREAEELKQKEIDEMDEVEIGLDECGFGEAEVQVDEVVDPLALWKSMKKEEKPATLVKVDNNYINTMKKLMAGLMTSNKAVYNRICGPHGKLEQYKKDGTQLPPPEDFAENFISFDEIQKIIAKMNDKKDGGEDDGVEQATGTGEDGDANQKRIDQEYKDTDNPFGNDLAAQNLYDHELTEAEESEAKDKAKEQLEVAKSKVPNGVDEDDAAEFLKKNKDKLNKVVAEIKDEKVRDDVKRLVKTVEKFADGKLDESMIVGEAKDAKKKGPVRQFIKGTLRFLNWILLIIPMGLLGSAWVLKGVGSASKGLMQKIDKSLAESLTLEVCEDEEAEELADSEELDENGCTKTKKDDVEESATRNEEDPVAHLLDPIGVKASTANLDQQDGVALSIVEKLLAKIEKLESKLEILESRAEKNSVDATSSKSVNESVDQTKAFNLLEKMNKLLDSKDISLSSPVRLDSFLSSSEGVLPAPQKFGLGGIVKKANMWILQYDSHYRFDGMLLSVRDLVDRFDEFGVNLEDVIGASCDPNGSRAVKSTSDLVPVIDVFAQNDVLIIKFGKPTGGLSESEDEIDEDDEEKIEGEEITIKKEDIEDSKMKFKSGLDKLPQEKINELFKEMADRINHSLEMQKKNGADPSIRHDQKEVRDAVKKINYFRKASYDHELTDAQKEEFANLVYRYWYDWIYTEEVDEDGEVHQKPVISIADMLNAPFKSFFGRPGDHVPFATAFKIHDNGNTYTLQNFNYTLDVDDHFQRKSIAKRKERQSLKAKRDAADAGKGYHPPRGRAGTWDIGEWNRMIGSLSDKRRKEVEELIRADIKDEVKDNPIKQAQELAFVKYLFNTTGREVDRKREEYMNTKKSTAKQRKQLAALKKQMEDSLEELDKRIRDLEKRKKELEARLKANPDDEEADNELVDLGWDLEDAWNDYTDKYDELQEIAKDPDVYAAKIDVGDVPDEEEPEDEEMGTFDKQGNFHTQDKRKGAVLATGDIAPMYGMSPQGYRQFERATVNMIMQALSDSTGIMNPKDLKAALTELSPKEWQKFINLLKIYSDSRVRRKMLKDPGTSDDTSGVLEIYDRALRDEYGEDYVPPTRPTVRSKPPAPPKPKKEVKHRPAKLI